MLVLQEQKLVPLETDDTPAYLPCNAGDQSWKGSILDRHEMEEILQANQPMTITPITNQA